MKIRELLMTTGYHYSNVPLKINDIIISNQSNGRTYNLVWKFYKKVAGELELYFPGKFGYAYPISKNNLSTAKYHYAVTAPADKVTSGNFDYSLYVTMASLSSFMDRSIRDFDARLANRDQLIQNQAIQYFTEIADINKVELISDRWRVLFGNS